MHKTIIQIVAFAFLSVQLYLLLFNKFTYARARVRVFKNTHTHICV